MKQTFKPQPGLRRSRPGFNREHAAFIGGLLIVALFELMLMAKGWSFD